MIDELIDRLAAQRFVLIHGASGSGKSSIVRAGVLPKLARLYARHGAPWLTCAMRPSGGPLWNLAAEFARLEGRGEDVGRIGEIIRLFNRRGARLSEIVDSLETVKGKRLCLLVDQFEELFRFERETSREEAELFIELLIAELAREPNADRTPEAIESKGPANLHIILTMRSEFLGECARFDGFAEAINRTQYLVPRLTRSGLMQAIQRPAQLYGGEVTLELAERLIADVRGQMDELPLIQHGLMLFWHERLKQKPVVLDASMLDQATSLAKLLSDHADRITKEATPKAPEITPQSLFEKMSRLFSQRRREGEIREKITHDAVERMFRALTDINAEGQAIRRPQTFRDLVATCGVEPQVLRGIIDAFRADGVSFVTPYTPTPIKDETIIDISHESLIRSWRAIADPENGWLRNEFEDGLVWRSLLLEGKEFEKNKSRLLSRATTAERRKWIRQRTKPWSFRYGGHWELVERLLKASRKATMRGQRILRVFYLATFELSFCFVFTAIIQWHESLYYKLHLGLFWLFITVLVVSWWIITLVLMILDYSAAFVRLVRSVTQTKHLQDATDTNAAIEL